MEISIYLGGNVLEKSYVEKPSCYWEVNSINNNVLIWTILNVSISSYHFLQFIMPHELSLPSTGPSSTPLVTAESACKQSTFSFFISIYIKS